MEFEIIEKICTVQSPVKDDYLDGQDREDFFSKVESLEADGFEVYTIDSDEKGILPRGKRNHTS